MQLLKLVHSYNTTSHQGTKLNPKNYYLSILENCVHVPKDDKLLIRKYLCGLKNFDENNQVLAILNKNSKKGKQNMDKKLEVLLRKIADRIRKSDQRQMLNKVLETQPKSNIPQATINVRKYCNNFDLLKTTLRVPSSRKSEPKSQEKSLNNSSKKLSVILKSMSPKNANIRQYSSTRSQKQIKPKGKLQYLKKPLFKIYQTKRATSQSSKNNKNSSKRLQKSCHKEEDTKQNHEVIFFQEEKPKHKYTRSRSLGDLLQNIGDIPTQNYLTSPNGESTQTPIFDPITTHHYENEQFSSFGNSQSETQYISNTTQYNFEQITGCINSASHSMTSFFTPQQYNTKSVHMELKELRLCSQDFLDYLMPISIKEARSPSDFSFLYVQFINKLNEFILQTTNKKLVCSSDTVYIPFHTQYDLVTFQKITQFLDQYTISKSSQNPVKDLYTRIEVGVCGTQASIFNHKRISISQFKNCYEWNKNAVQKFQRLVRRCTRWGSCLMYWELYWLKDSQEFREFQKQFNS